MYGCLGYNLSRFYAKPIAMLITSKGREILQNTKTLAEEKSYDVVYGDTDSIMINTRTDNLDIVKKIGNEIKSAVNEKYKLLEIEIDGYFRKMLLLKKKKYAALIINESNGKVQKNIEKKGIDVVRREWCSLSINASNFILDQLFSDIDREESIENIYNYLEKLSGDIRNKVYSADNFIINKSLSKNPEDYPDGKSQPHVQVALRLKTRGIGCHAGDTIQYIICKDDDKKSYAEKAYHPDELKMNDKLEIDYEWYLNQQILPPIMRLCEPIEETDSYKLSKCLGLDASKYQASAFMNNNENNDFTFESHVPIEEKYKDVEKWTPKCNRCKQKYIFVGSEIKKEELEDGKYIIDFHCPNEECKKENYEIPIASLAAQLHCAIRKHIREYNNNVLKCDNVCATRTRQMSVYGTKCLYPDCAGTMSHEYSDKMLYTQLEYYIHLFDTEEMKKVYKESTKDKRYNGAITYKEQYDALKFIADTYMKRNARKFVDLSKLFRFLDIKKRHH